MLKLLLVLSLLSVPAVAAEEEHLPGTPGTIVIPARGHTPTGTPARSGSVIIYGGRFGGFFPLETGAYLGYDKAAWRFEAFVNLEGGDWKAVGSLAFISGLVKDSPAYRNTPSFWTIPVGIGVYYHFGDNFSPYAGGGVGFAISHLSEVVYADHRYTESSTELLFWPHLAVGMDLFRYESFRVNVEARLELGWGEERGQVGGFSLLAGLAF